MRVKLLYGKRGQAVDLSDYDADLASDGNQGYLGYSRATGGFRPRLPAASGNRVRRGPTFPRVEWLTNEGYYDLEDERIANDLDQLVREFAVLA
ncbi:hypothetical protein GCM10027266_15850 [Arenimonas alkanexedens]